jgi:predicted transcriptional regulator
MNELKEKILDIFREFKTPVNGVLNPKSIEGRILKWNRTLQENTQQSITELISEGYVGSKEGWLTLTQKGYDFLYNGYSILETESIILDFLAKRNLGVGNVIMQNWFNSELTKLERIHFDNFNTALQNIIDKGFIDAGTNGWFLTQKGYDEIY